MKFIDYQTAIANRVGKHDIDCQAVKDEENENLTEQSHKKDCDINEIVARYEKTGYLDPFITRSGGVYGDFTQFQDFQENLNTVIQAQDAFDSLPAFIRKRFDNDPARLMEFLENNDNKEEAIKLGLVNPPKEVPQTPIEPKAQQKSKKQSPPSEEE